MWLHPWYMEVPGPRSNLSHSCDLGHSCGNARSLTHCSTVGTPNSRIAKLFLPQDFCTCPCAQQLQYLHYSVLNPILDPSLNVSIARRSSLNSSRNKAVLQSLILFELDLGVIPCRGHCPNPLFRTEAPIPPADGVLSKGGSHLSPSLRTVLSLRKLPHLRLCPFLVVGSG